MNRPELRVQPEQVPAMKHHARTPGTISLAVGGALALWASVLGRDARTPAHSTRQRPEPPSEVAASSVPRRLDERLSSRRRVPRRRPPPADPTFDRSQDELELQAAFARIMTASDPEPTPEMEFSEMRERWQGEDTDEAWTQDMRQHWQAMLDDLKVNGELKDVSCGQTVCMGEFDLASGGDLADLARGAGDSPTRRSVATEIDNESGRASLKVFIDRGTMPDNASLHEAD